MSMILTPIPMCGFFSYISYMSDTRYGRTAIQFNSYNIYLKTVLDPPVSPARLLFSPLQMLISNSDYTYASYIWSVAQKFQWPHSWVELICHRSLPEHRETFYLLFYQFIIKLYNSGIARWKRYIRQGVGRGTEVPEACLLGFYGNFTVEVWLIISLPLVFLQCLSSPWGPGMN